MSVDITDWSIAVICLALVLLALIIGNVISELNQAEETKAYRSCLSTCMIALDADTFEKECIIDCNKLEGYNGF